MILCEIVNRRGDIKLGKTEPRSKHSANGKEQTVAISISIKGLRYGRRQVSSFRGLPEYRQLEGPHGSRIASSKPRSSG